MLGFLDLGHKVLRLLAKKKYTYSHFAAKTPAWILFFLDRFFVPFSPLE